MKTTITIKEQECNNENYDFNIRMVITKNLLKELNEIGDANEIIMLSHISLLQRYGQSNIDYLQVFQCNGLEYWCISNKLKDEEFDETYHCVTWLLPSDY